VPVPGGVWAVRLTVPGERAEGRAATLFDVLADGFTPAPA
jgi:eukaryotic-like serine/threonine-protein kinase